MHRFPLTWARWELGTHFGISPVLRTSISLDLYPCPLKAVLAGVWLQHLSQWFGFHPSVSSPSGPAVEIDTGVCRQARSALKPVYSWLLGLFCWKKQLIFLVKAQWQDHKKYYIVSKSCIYLPITSFSQHLEVSEMTISYTNCEELYHYCPGLLKFGIRKSPGLRAQADAADIHWPRPTSSKKPQGWLISFSVSPLERRGPSAQSGLAWRHMNWAQLCFLSILLAEGFSACETGWWARLSHLLICT